MLYLNPPYPIINGVSFFPDHKNPLQWYYQPIGPHLSTMTDTATGLKIPQLQIIKFRGDAGEGGFLNFDVNLGIEQTVLDDLATELKRVMRLTSNPILSPVPLESGTVRLMLFGEESPVLGAHPSPGGAATVPPPTTPHFVLKIQHNAQPALYGENQAAFSVALNKDGVALLDKALQGEMSPIGIIYSLDFLALRPAYQVRLVIDWDRVQKHLDETFGADVIFFSSQITTAVDELVDKRIIDIQVDTFVPEGEDNSTIIASRERARDEVLDMVTESFFTPSVQPVREEEDGWDKAEHFAKTMGALHATGGFGGIGSFSYKKMDYTRIDRKVLNVNISERTTVLRSIYPQAHLTGLFRLLQQPGLDRNRFILQVDTNDPWFQKRRLKIISRGNFAGDGLTSLNVRLRYGNEPKNVILTAPDQTADLEWNSVFENGVRQNDVRLRYAVNFKDVNTMERPQTLESEERIVTEESEEIFPEELFALEKVNVFAAPLFPWTRFSQIQVELRYEDPAHGIAQNDVLFLDKDHTSADWTYFLRDRTRREYQHKVTYFGIDNRNQVEPWTMTDPSGGLRLPDPFAGRWAVDVVPLVDWKQVQNVFCDLSYRDDENAIVQEESFAFSDTENTGRRFEIALENPDHRLLSYTVTFLMKDLTMREVGKSVTRGNRIILKQDMRGHRIAELRTENAPFAAKNLREIRVEARYMDAVNGIIFEDNGVLRAPTDVFFFEYDFADPNLDAEFRGLYLYQNGVTLETDWERIEGTTAHIAVR